MISYILCTYFVVGQLANDYYSVAWGVGESIWIKWLHWFYMNSWSSDDEPAHDPRNNLCSFHPLSHFDGWQSLAAHVRWGESTTSELQIMTIWEFVAWDVQRQIQVSRASCWSCTAWPVHAHEWIKETIVWKRTCWLQTHFSNEYDKLNYAMDWANHSSENRIHFFPRPQHKITSIIVQIKMD